MPAVDLLVAESAAVATPADSGKAEIDPLDGWLDLGGLDLFGLRLRCSGDVKNIQLERGKFIARQRIGPLVQPGSAPVARRRLDEINQPFVARLDAKRYERGRIRRPYRRAVGI